MAMTDWDDLDQFLGDVPEEDYETPPAQLDADRANRMLRKLRRLLQWKEGTAATANAEIARIAEWRDGRVKMIEGEIGRLEAALEGYTRAANRVNPKVKTQNLPNGALRLRSPRTRVVVDAPELAINFLLHSAAGRSMDVETGEVKVPFSTIDAVLDAINAEPMLRVKLEISASEVAKATERGALLASVNPDGYESNVYQAMLPSGVAIDGVFLHQFSDDTFTYTLNTGEMDDPQDGGPAEEEL